VTSNADSGPGTLRQALVDTCYQGTIEFDMASVVGPIGLTSGELVMAKDVIISGPGANLLTIQRVSGTFRILSVRSGVSSIIEGVTLANGDATTSAEGGGGGGAIYNTGGFLQIAATELVGNTANQGGAIYSGGAFVPSAVVMFGNTLRGNSAVHGGGA